MVSGGVKKTTLCRLISYFFYNLKFISSQCIWRKLIEGDRFTEKSSSESIKICSKQFFLETDEEENIWYWMIQILFLVINWRKYILQCIFLFDHLLWYYNFIVNYCLEFLSVPSNQKHPINGPFRCRLI